MVQAAQGEAEGRIQQLTAQLEEAQAAPPTGTPSLLMCFPPTALILWKPLHCAFLLLCSKDCLKRFPGRLYVLDNHIHCAAWVTVLIRHLGYQADVSKLHVQPSPSSSLWRLTLKGNKEQSSRNHLHHERCCCQEKPEIFLNRKSSTSEASQQGCDKYESLHPTRAALRLLLFQQERLERSQLEGQLQCMKCNVFSAIHGTC